jgi:hypothetical protein
VLTLVSKSNPHDSQNRPDLAVPQRGQGSAYTCGGGSGGWAAGAGGGPAGSPIFTPQTSQKSLLADV